MFALNGLPQFYHPVFAATGIERATDDRFLLVVEASDPKFDIEETPRLLSELGAVRDGSGGEMKSVASHSPLHCFSAGCARQTSRHPLSCSSRTWITRVDMSRRAIELSMADIRSSPTRVQAAARWKAQWRSRIVLSNDDSFSTPALTTTCTSAATR